MLIKLKTCGCVGYHDVSEREANRCELRIVAAIPYEIKVGDIIDPQEPWAKIVTRKFAYTGTSYDDLHHKRMPVFEERAE